MAHEQQLAMKGNEIRQVGANTSLFIDSIEQGKQRDNSIKALEKRKLELESMLARCLNTQVRIEPKRNRVWCTPDNRRPGRRLNPLQQKAANLSLTSVAWSLLRHPTAQALHNRRLHVRIELVLYVH